MKPTWVVALLLAAALTGAALAWSGVRQEREFRRLIAVGDAALARDETPLAIEAFSGAVALKPDSMLGYLKRGDTYRRRTDYDAALRDLGQAVALDPAALRPLELLGDVLMAKGQYERAASEYGRVTAIDDRSPRVLYKLALAHYRHGHAASALEPLRQAIAINDRVAESHYLLGVCLRDRQRDADALRALLRAVNLDRAFAPARVELADLYTALGRNREAIDQLEALAALEPARAERLVAVGLAYARVGRADRAVITLGRAAERHPHEPSVYAALGRVWLDDATARADRGALSKALEALEPIASRDTADGEALTLYGRALFLAGDTATAHRVLTQATSRLPVDPLAFLYLSAADERLSRAQAARSALMQYTTLTRSSAMDAEVRASGLLDLQRELRLSGVGSSPGRARREGRLPGN